MPTNLIINKTNKIKAALTNAKFTENEIKEERAITWLNEKTVCFLNKTKININGEWAYIGDAEIQDFQNTEEGIKLLKQSVPEPFLTAVLAVWDKNLIDDEITKILNQGDIKNE